MSEIEAVASAPVSVAPVLAPYVPAPDRYASMPYRRLGRSGLAVPAISLGMWYNFGNDCRLDVQTDIVKRAFDLGITHFDLANNYGPPFGAAESNFGQILARQLSPWRDEIVISTKAGYCMWPGPYGEWGSRKYMLSSLDQSLKRLGVDYVDIFYSHRFDPVTPLEETMGALDSAVRQGKALYAGISSYSAGRTLQAHEVLAHLGTPLLVHQPSYSMLNRWIEHELLNVLGGAGIGCVAFAPLAQGLLTGKYAAGRVPPGSRMERKDLLTPADLKEGTLQKVHELSRVAAARGQSLPQLALSWALRDSRVSSVIIGASSVEQLEENVGALKKMAFSDEERAEIDEYATDSGVNPWARSSEG